MLRYVVAAFRHSLREQASTEYNGDIVFLEDTRVTFEGRLLLFGSDDDLPLWSIDPPVASLYLVVTYSAIFVMCLCY